MRVTRHPSVSGISRETWKRAHGRANPFLDYEFHVALEKSGSVGGLTGWRPLYWSAGDAAAPACLYAFEKSHSYGEYIFDWEWADAYRRSGAAYYPKLVSMVPFTPVSTPHILLSSSDPAAAEGLLDAFEEFYEDGPYSSSHFLFLPPGEAEFFAERGYAVRDSFQYHFINRGYGDFAGFLSRLKARKAKRLREERRFPDEMRFESLTGASLRPEHAAEMYLFYLATIEKKGAIAYLTRDFFLRLFEKLPEKVLYVRAVLSETPVAGALYLYDDKRLYGRYWGTLKESPGLHFELCLYRGMDFLLERGLAVFEAGAQGEHKLLRGFEPVLTKSAHKIKHPAFHEGVTRYVRAEREHVGRMVAELSSLLPFRKRGA